MFEYLSNWLSLEEIIFGILGFIFLIAMWFYERRTSKETTGTIRV